MTNYSQDIRNISKAKRQQIKSSIEYVSTLNNNNNKEMNFNITRVKFKVQKLTAHEYPKKWGKLVHSVLVFRNSKQCSPRLSGERHRL